MHIFCFDLLLHLKCKNNFDKSHLSLNIRLIPISKPRFICFHYIVNETIVQYILIDILFAGLPILAIQMFHKFYVFIIVSYFFLDLQYKKTGISFSVPYIMHEIKYYV